MNYKTFREDLEVIGLDRDEIKEVIQEVSRYDHADFESNKYRFIQEYHIDFVFNESVIDQIKECYNLGDIPSFIEIDWDTTVENCKVDGYGHHFAHYDGEEHESEGYYIFRVN
jgi:hypothetical protein